MSSAYQQNYTQENNPLVDYGIHNMWGNPELPSQYQIKLARVSGLQGFVNDFVYMGKRRYLPTTYNFYHVFTMGGLDTGFWNFGNRGKSWYPVDTWVSAAAFARNRAVAIDVYKGDGTMFPREGTLIMPCFDGVTLVAIPVNKNFDMPLDKNLYIHCYSSDINVLNMSAANALKFSFGYIGSVYETGDSWTRILTNYNAWKDYNMGMVSFYHNGKLKPIEGVALKSGDLVEVTYDPSIEMILSYDYATMPDYLSVLDNKRKVILFPGFDDSPRYYRYYADCHFYITNKRNNEAYYFNRNSIDAVRQLTHQDYGMTGDYIEYLGNRLIKEDPTGKTKMSDIQITVAYHNVRWKVKLGPTASRINDLYLLEDRSLILGAMTGSASNVKEWQAATLENAPTNFVLNGIVQQLTTETVRDGLGYHGCSVAMSNSPLYMPYVTPEDPGFDNFHPTAPFTSGLGYQVPPTFIESSTAYEYDKDGLLLRVVPVKNTQWYMPQKDGFYVEWALGQGTTWLDYVISKTDVKLRDGFGFRVYKAKWAIDPDYNPDDITANEVKVSTDGTDPYGDDGREIKVYRADQTTNQDGGDLPPGGYPVGDWIDITDDSTQYGIQNGYIHWLFDTVNWVGMVVFNTVHLYNEFDLEHIDNSLSFGITFKWSIGGVQLPMEPGQIDIWMNRHPLIENVDYIMDFPNVYIINKMWLKEGPQFIQYRATGLSKRGLVNTSELGFVADGVIGYNGRYNLRIDRPTKTIINGRLFLTDSIDWAENINHGTNLTPFNGMPYEVKHIYSANKYVDKYDSYWGYDEAITLDETVGNYLTANVKYKPYSPVNPVYLATDRYTLFSPFLSMIVNELVLGFMDAPTPSGRAVPYSPQTVDEIIKDYEWLLKYDPIILGLDLQFFTVHPYSNLTRPTVTPNQLTFIKMVNDLYLKGKVAIEGHFEVKQ
jgi:hypothetical protein